MSEEDYRTFCISAVEAQTEIFGLMRSPLENLAHRVGFQTPRVKKFEKQMDIIDVIGRRRLTGFMEQVEKDNLTPEEKNSYVSPNQQLQCTRV